MSACRSCGADIVWAVTAAGKRMPVDAEPVPEGNVALVDLASGEIHATVLGEGEALLAEEPLHLSHFATCVFADQHRRPR